MLKNRISYLRNEVGLTQLELANKINISRASLSHYEAGRRDPDTSTLEKLADFFNVSIDYLVGRTNSRQSSEITYNLTETEFATPKNSFEDDLPPEAIEEIARFKDYIRHKYKKNKP